MKINNNYAPLLRVSRHHPTATRNPQPTRLSEPQPPAGRFSSWIFTPDANPILI